MFERPATALMGAIALTVGSCNQEGAPEPEEPGTAAAEIAAVTSAANTEPTTTPTAPTTEDARIAGENDGSPDITPAPLTGEAARTETGARAILLSWARGIELREFDQAWAMMGDAAKAQTSRAQFNALFHPLRGLTVAAPSGTMEGAAGSSYYTVPTTVTGTRADGSPAILKGDVVLRRVNDVPGATPAQLTWHIESMSLTPA